jgi:hypothetical protein
VLESWRLWSPHPRWPEDRQRSRMCCGSPFWLGIGTVYDNRLVFCSTSPAAGADVRTLLHAAATVLLSATSEPLELRAAAGEAHALFTEIAGFKPKPDSPDEVQDRLLPGGVAISPRAAALCLTDHLRTAAFVRGVHDAIANVRARFLGETIDVVYAGCGPFAPLFVLPLLVMEPDGIQFTLIDAHQRSSDATRRIVRALRLEGNVRDYICSDAATYRHPGDHAIHLAITETMQRALENETQVAITANLAPQLRRGGVLLPERISVVAYLVDRAKEFTPPEAPERDRIRLAELLEVSAQTAHTLHSPPAVRVAIPKVTGNCYMLALFTFIDVFGPHSIDEYASGLTSPLWLRDFRAEDTPAVLEFTYESGHKPGFRYV